MAVAERASQESIDNVVLEVISADYTGGYKLRVRFSDSTENEVDFAPFLSESHHPAIRKYLDTKLFQSYTLEQGNIIWNDYDMIFPIADLYEGTIR